METIKIKMAGEYKTHTVKQNKAVDITFAGSLVKEIKISGDGAGILRFNSQMDYVELNNLNILAGEIIQIMFKADIETNSSNEED
jgi:hypothetical protein